MVSDCILNMFISSKIDIRYILYLIHTFIVYCIMNIIC